MPTTPATEAVARARARRRLDRNVTTLLAVAEELEDLETAHALECTAELAHQAHLCIPFAPSSPEGDAALDGYHDGREGVPHVDPAARATATAIVEGLASDELEHGRYPATRLPELLHHLETVHKSPPALVLTNCLEDATDLLDALDRRQAAAAIGLVDRWLARPVREPKRIGKQSGDWYAQARAGEDLDKAGRAQRYAAHHVEGVGPVMAEVQDGRIVSGGTFPSSADR